jgi:hypothetical protein
MMNAWKFNYCATVSSSGFRISVIVWILVMSQIGSSNGWFTQLQKHYPMGALVTELVQIHQERFIVKALVQVGGVSIATSMAESDTLEMAEDHARFRVLDLLGISAIAQPSNSLLPIAPDPLPAPTNRDRFPDPLPEISLPEISLPEISLPEIPLPEIPSTSINQPIENGFPVEAYPSLDLETIELPAPLPLPEIPSVVPLPTVPLPTLSTPDFSMPFSTPLFSEETMPPEEDAIDDFREEYFPSVEDDEAGYEGEPEDIFPEDILVQTEPVAEIAPTNPIEENDPLVSLNSSNPKKAIAVENPVAANLAEAIEPDDLSTLIAYTDVEMDRIGWTKQRGRDYLKSTYKKSTRQRLDVDELMDFLNYLRALPSVNGI